MFSTRIEREMIATLRLDVSVTLMLNTDCEVSPESKPVPLVVRGVQGSAKVDWVTECFVALIFSKNQCQGLFKELQNIRSKVEADNVTDLGGDILGIKRQAARANSNLFLCLALEPVENLFKLDSR